MPIEPGIYRIQCLATGEAYIGRSWDMKLRVRTHACQLAGGYHPCDEMQTAYNAHGIGQFEVCIVEHGQRSSHLKDRERYWIERLQPAFNCQLGGFRKMKRAPSEPRPSRQYVDAVVRNQLNDFAEDRGIFRWFMTAWMWEVFQSVSDEEQARAMQRVNEKSMEWIEIRKVARDRQPA